jgi:hypothetical protein
MTSEPTPNASNPFIFESIVTVPPRRTRPPPLPSPEPNDDYFLRPFLNVFRLDPFSTHDGVHGRPTPSAVSTHYSSRQTQPEMIEFQLQFPGMVRDEDSPEPARRRQKSVKHEDSASTAHSPRRSLYLDQSTFFPFSQESTDTGSSPTNEDQSSPNPLLYPESDYDSEQDRARLNVTPVVPSDLRSPTRTSFPDIVVRSPQQVFRPLAQRPSAPSQTSFQMHSPLPVYPTSLAYDAEVHTQDSRSGSETFYAPDSSRSPLNAPHLANSYGYTSFGYGATNVAEGYTATQPQHTSQPNDSVPAQNYYDPQPRPESRFQPQPFFQSHSRSFSESEYHASSTSPPHPFNSFEEDVPAQPPVTTFHERSSDVFPQRFPYHSYDHGKQTDFANSTLGARYASKDRFPSPSLSPVPAFSRRLSPVISARDYSRSPSRTISASPTPSVASAGSTWPERSRSQRRLDLAPYILGGLRKNYATKSKQHTCTVSTISFIPPGRDSCMRAGMRQALQTPVDARDTYEHAYWRET